MGLLRPRLPHRPVSAPCVRAGLPQTAIDAANRLPGRRPLRRVHAPYCSDGDTTARAFGANRRILAHAADRHLPNAMQSGVVMARWALWRRAAGTPCAARRCGPMAAARSSALAHRACEIGTPASGLLPCLPRELRSRSTHASKRAPLRHACSMSAAHSRPPRENHPSTYEVAESCQASLMFFCAARFRGSSP